MNTVVAATGASIRPGIRVHQIAPIGLMPFLDDPFVVDVVDGKLLLSRTPDGEPITDYHGAPHPYPPGRFVPAN